MGKPEYGIYVNFDKNIRKIIVKIALIKICQCSN